jgi:cyclopropane fatty-acyl-phospholipid synthase-like methyltransferase
MDSADAYERHASEFLALRDKSTIGAEIAQVWAQTLKRGTEVIEIGCGGGVPVTQALADAGLRLWAVDASPTLISAFRARFPEIPAQCARAQEADFFKRRFGAAIAIGFVFLLSECEQVSLIRRVSEILLPGGRFLFTAPIETGTWTDVNTGHASRSLGRAMYETVFRESGFRLVSTHEDEGMNNYYEVEKIKAPPR